MKSKFPWIVLAAIHFAFFICAMNGAHTELKDSAEYLSQSRNIQGGAGWYCGNLQLPFQEALLSQRPPLYGLFLSVLQVPPSSHAILFLLQGVFCFFNCWLAYRITQMIVNKKIGALLFLLPLVVFPTQFIYANMVMSEMLFQTFLLVAIYFGVQYLRRNRGSDLWKHQLIMTCTFLVKPITVLLPFVFFFLLAFYLYRKRETLLPLFTFILPLSVVTVVCWHNYSQTKVVEYSSISRKLMINYNVYLLTEEIKGPEKAFAEIDSVQKAATMLPYPEQVELISSFCLNRIGEHPFRYMSLHLYGAWRFFMDPCNWELNHFFHADSGEKHIYKLADPSSNRILSQRNGWLLMLYTGISVLVNLLLLLTFLIAILLKNTDAKFRVFLAVIVLYFACMTGPSASSRFRLPVFPVLLITFALFSSKIEEEVTLQIKSRD